MSYRMMALSAVALAALAGGCATREDLRTLRRPLLPPTSVALAEPGERLYRSVFVYEILGAPEFRLFDGGGVYTTRPTRGRVNAMVREWLGEAHMQAPDIRHGRYLLTIEFTDLHGPDVIWFTDKHATARVRYKLEDARTHEPVFERTYDAAFEARMPGVTPEMVRAGIGYGLTAGLVGGLVNNEPYDTNAQVAAGVLGFDAGVGGALVGAMHDTLLWDWRDRNLDTDGERLTVPRMLYGGAGGAFWGGLAAGALEAPPGHVSDFEAGLAVGGAAAIAAFRGAAPVGLPAEHTEDTSAIGAFDGAERRNQAVHGMMLQNFNRFLAGLDEAQLLTIRRAVPCAELNPYPDRPRDPDEQRFGIALRTSSRDAVGYDCPIRIGSRR